MPLIREADHLEKKFGSNHAVKGISFNVEEGDVFGLLGPNGPGKTTTISMLTGVLKPTAGTVHIGGHDIRSEPFTVDDDIEAAARQSDFLATLETLIPPFMR